MILKFLFQRICDHSDLFFVSVFQAKQVYLTPILLLLQNHCSNVIFEIFIQVDCGRHMLLDRVDHIINKMNIKNKIKSHRRHQDNQSKLPSKVSNTNSQRFYTTYTPKKSLATAHGGTTAQTQGLLSQEKTLQINQNLSKPTIKLAFYESTEDNLQVDDKDQLNQQQHFREQKQHLYSKLRKKLVKQYPQMRKHYTQRNINLDDSMSIPIQLSQNRTHHRTSYAIGHHEESRILQKRYTPVVGCYNSHQKAYTVQFDHHSEKRHSILTLNNNSIYAPRKSHKPKSVSLLLQEQLNRQERKRSEKRKHNRITQIFKQSEFYSRSKNKCFHNYLDIHETNNVQQQVKTCDISFINYLKHRNKNIIKRDETKVKNLIKNRQLILRIEKQGSKRQQYLKKCIEDAIEGLHDKQ